MWTRVGAIVFLLSAPAFGITWHFDRDGDTQGWLAQDVPGGAALQSTHEPLRSTVTDGIWRIAGPAYEPERTPTVGMLSPPLGLTSSLFDRLEVRCRVVHHSPLSGYSMVVWANEHNRWDAPRSNAYEYSFSSGHSQVYTGEWQEITLAPLASGLGLRPSLWEGELEAVQIRLVLGASASLGGTTWTGGQDDIPEAVEIDWIRLTGVEEQLQGELPPPEFSADTPCGRLFAPAVFYPLHAVIIDGWNNRQNGALGDLDGDGDLDLVAPWRHRSGSLAVQGWLTAENTGGGVFAPADRLVATGDDRVVGIDMNQDGRMDVISVGPNHTDLTYYRNDPEEGWVVDSRISGESLLGVGDLEGDGDADLWTREDLSEDGETLWVRRNRGDGSLEPPVSLGRELFAEGLHPGALVYARGPAGQALQYWSSRSRIAVAYWDESMTPVIRSAPLTDGYWLYWGDVDLDGDVDLVYTEAHGFDQIPLWKGMHIAFNNGDGTAADLAWEEDVDLTAAVSLVELNGDGRPDLVFVDSDVRQPAVVVCLGVSDGLPIQEGRYPICGRGGAIITGDVDNDGDTDLVVYERTVDGQGGVHVLLNQVAERMTAVTDGGASGNDAAAEHGAAAAFPNPPRLHPAYPNPFNPETVIPFTLPRALQSVQLRIYNTVGQPVRTLVDGPLPAGAQQVTWDGRDGRGVAAPSGTYFIRLETHGESLAAGKVVRVE